MEAATDRSLKDVVYTLVSIYLGADFIVAGLSNFTSDFDFDTRFGYPAWIQIPIGISETLGGVGLLHPRTNLMGLAILTVVMSGAVYSHFAARDGGYATPLKYLIYFAVMLYYKIRRTA